MTVAPALGRATERASASPYLAAAGAVAGAAAWFTRGSFDRIEGPGQAVRIALLPALTELPLLMLFCAAGTWLLATGLQRRLGRHTRAEAFWIFSPLFALGVLALPYLPIAADAIPALAVLAGPAKLLVWAAVMCCTTVLMVNWIRASRRAGGTGPLDFAEPPGSPASNARASLKMFAVGAVICGGIGIRLATVGPHPGGDEPHYLVIAQSIWRDGDLQIANNHARGDYREYYGAPLDPHYLTKGRNGQIYSIHPVGLPVLIAPVYALGGYPGVVLFLTTVGAAAAALMWRHVAHLSGRRSATFAWAAVCLSASYCLNALTVYPEIVAALAVMIAVRPLFTPLRPGTAVWSGLAIALLPWLSTKYAPMAGVLAVILVVRAQRSPSTSPADRRRTSLALVGPGVVSLAGWLGFFFVVWGTLSPSAPYGGSTTTQARYALAGVPGLLLDQEYGVMFYAPVLLIAGAGLASLWRAGGPHRRLAIEIATVFTALLVPVGAFHIWWGGSAVPGRPIASGLLLLGMPIAWQHARASPAGRALHWLLLVASIIITATILVVQQGLLTANVRDGSSRLLEWLSPDWPLWSLFPSFIAQPPLRALTLAAVWLGSMTLVWRWLRRRAESESLSGARGLTMAGRTVTSALLATLGVYAVLSLVGPALRAASPARASLEARARSPLLDRFDATRRPFAVVYAPFSVVPPDALPPMIRFSARRGDDSRPTPVPLLFNARFALPAGRYRAEVAAEPGASGPVDLHIGRDGPSVSTWPLDKGVCRFEFSLGVDATFVGFRVPATLEPHILSVAIQPIEVVDAHERTATPEVLGALQAGNDTLYLHDRNAWIEPSAFWTRGESTTTFTIVPAGAPTLPMQVNCGPRENSLTLSSEGWRVERHLAAGERGEIAVPTPSDGRALMLSIATDHGFTPASVVAGSRDRRFLGCRFEIEGDRR